jgi:hypothetical protein
MTDIDGLGGYSFLYVAPVDENHEVGLDENLDSILSFLRMVYRMSLEQRVLAGSMI